MIDKILYALAAAFLGGNVFKFEGRDSKGKWHKGLCILSPEAFAAHKAAFRPGAQVYSDTALTDPDQ